MKSKKLLIALLAAASATCLAFGLAACTDNNGNSGNSGGNGPGDEIIEPDKNGEILLSYGLNNDGTYSIDGIGEETGTDIRIPAFINGTAVKGVSAGAFEGNTRITGVNFDEGITEIGIGAFAGCSGLKSVTLPNSLTTVGATAFQACISITGVHIGTGLTAISNSMFNGCSKLTSISIPANVKSIGDSAFFGCSSLRNVNIGSGVETIASRAFAQCTGITELDMTGATSLTTLGNNVFEANSSMIKIVIPNSVQTIGQSLLIRCSSIEFISIPFCGSHRLENPQDYKDTMTDYTHFSYLFGAVDPYASNRSLEDIAGRGITVKVTDVTDSAPVCFGAFYNCIGIKTIIIEGSITRLREGAFSTVGNETEEGINIVLPNTISSIAEACFFQTTIDHLYFTGTAGEWAAVKKEASNGNIAGSINGVAGAKSHFVGTWHYDEMGNPVAN